MVESALVIEDLHVFIGTAHILQGVSLTIAAEPVAIIGRNGMGKTTLCDTLFGLRWAQSGRIVYGDREITKIKPQVRSHLGLAYVPQGRRLFPHLTVREHLALATYARRQRGQGASRIDVLELFPKLGELEGRQARVLSGGEQQMLAIARALLTQPSLLVLDEPSEGLAPVAVAMMVAALRRLSSTGMRLLLVEQNLRVAASVASQLAVMVNGRIVEETHAADFLHDRQAQERLLGLQV